MCNNDTPGNGNVNDGKSSGSWGFVGIVNGTGGPYGTNLSVNHNPNVWLDDNISGEP